MCQFVFCVSICVTSNYPHGVTSNGQHRFKCAFHGHYSAWCPEKTAHWFFPAAIWNRCQRAHVHFHICHTFMSNTAFIIIAICELCLTVKQAITTMKKTLVHFHRIGGQSDGESCVKRTNKLTLNSMIYLFCCFFSLSPCDLIRFYRCTLLWITFMLISIRINVTPFNVDCVPLICKSKLSLMNWCRWRQGKQKKSTTALRNAFQWHFPRQKKWNVSFWMLQLKAKRNVEKRLL